MTVRVGVQLYPQHTTADGLRRAWREADAMGVDSIWLWDHFFPLSGPPDGAHFECWSLLAAMAVETDRAMIGALVTCNTYRNPDLLADMARTIDHLSGGRMYLGIGSGWFERDYAEYGYPFTTSRERQAALAASLPRIAARLAKLVPPPIGRMPIMIGSRGPKVGLRIVAQHADAWNTFGTPAEFATRSALLDDWCTRVGRDPREIERTIVIDAEAIPAWRDYARAGAEHIIVAVDAPYDLAPAWRLLDEARAAG